MVEINLEYEIDNHYDINGRGFIRNPKFVTSDGRVYAPLCLVGDNEISIDIGGTDRQVPLNSHLKDKLHGIQTKAN